MTGLLLPLLNTLGPAAVLLVMAVVLAESGLLLGFFLPGDSLLFTTGLLVAGGVIGVPLWLVVVGVAAAAIAGDQVGYLVGRRYGPRLMSRPESRFFKPAHLERAARFFERHGPRAVVLARFVPVVRTFTPVTAGSARMSHARFAAYNAVGGVLWTVTMLLAGHLLGGVPIVKAHVELITLGVVGLSLLPAAGALVLARLRRQPDAAQEPAQEDVVLVGARPVESSHLG